MKKVITDLMRNTKIEIVTVFLYLVAYLFYCFSKEKNINILNIDFSSYFSQDRLNGIAAFFAITIGVYVAVITVLATSEIGISKEMLKRRLDVPMINVIIVGMVENFISAGLSIFSPMNKYVRFILLIFITISIISFIKFIFLLVAIFKSNMNQMAKAIDEEEKYKDEILTYMNGIYQYVKAHENK